MINLKKLFSFIFLFLITYLIYVYPFDILLYFLFNESIVKLSSLYFSIFFTFILIYYFSYRSSFIILRLFVYEGMGIGFLSFWIVNLGILVDLLLDVKLYYLGLVCIAIIIVFTIKSLINGRSILLKSIKIFSEKVKRDYRLIFISDVHLGSNKKDHLEKIYLKLKNINFDLLLIGGDLIDSSQFDLDDLIIFKKIKQPILFVSGNHEYYIKNSSKILESLKKFDIKFLNNQSFKYQNINIIGISDNEDLESQKLFKNKLIDDKLFNLILVHKPSLWSFVGQKVDLMLSGHTHNGQIFPFNLIVKLKFKYIYGLYEKLNSKLYVSCGSGCWGPKMRLGSKNELVQVLISEKNKSA